MPLPTIPSTELQTGFLFLALVMGIWWTFAVGKVYAPASGAGWNISRAAVGLVTFVLWVALLFGVSQQTWAHNFDSFPPPALRVFLVLILLTIVIAFSSVGRKLAAELPLIWLVGFQVFRLPVEWLLYQAASAGLAPVEMTFEGRNFDIVTPILALVIVMLLRKGAVSAKLIMAWNLLGLALLLNVVITAVMAMPHPLQMLHTTPPNVWITYFPFILLPGVLVCSALLGHLLVFRALAIQGKAKRPG